VIGEFTLNAQTYPLIRMLLAEEIHRRAYHDAGVEVSPGGLGPEAGRTYILATPHCLQGRRVLARLSWPLDQVRLARGDGVFASWPEFCEHAFTQLDAANWRTRRHLGCFHRRGKARYDLTFSVARHLVTGHGATEQTRMWAWHGAAGEQHFTELIARSGMDAPCDRPSRHLLVECCGKPLAALRSDGWVSTPHGVLEIDELWWRGVPPARLAAEIRGLTEHEHH